MERVSMDVVVVKGSGREKEMESSGYEEVIDSARCWDQRMGRWNIGAEMKTGAGYIYIAADTGGRHDTK